MIDHRGTVVIGIPVFNESRNILPLLESINRDPLISARNVHIAIFDDCSTDRTSEILRNVQPCFLFKQLNVHTSSRRVGKSAGLNWIASFARRIGSEILCFMDGDIVIGESSLFKLVRCLEVAPSNHIISPLVLPLVNDLHFPLLEICSFKIRTEPYRKKYRPYVHGRAFALRSSDFPELPHNLRQCDDKYLTMKFGRDKIIACLEAVFYYYPPTSVSDFLKDRTKTQLRLIRLSEIDKETYSNLRNKRFSFFHTYISSYPADVKFLILRSLSKRELLALIIERILTILAKIIGEISHLLKKLTHSYDTFEQ